MSNTDVTDETTEQDTAVGTPQDVVRAYFEAGNRSDIDGVLALFAKDAVVMAEGWETTIGRDEIRSVYERTLAPSRVRRDLRVKVDDIVEGDDVAVAPGEPGELERHAGDMSRTPLVIASDSWLRARAEGSRWDDAGIGTRAWRPSGPGILVSGRIEPSASLGS